MTGGPDRVVTAPTLLPSLDPAQVDAVHRLAAAARHTDGAAPLNEHALLHLRDPVGSDSRHLLTTEADRLTGYAYLDLSGDGAMTADCVVAPGSRGRGLGRSLVRALIGASDPRQVTVWSHGDHPAAAAVAAHVGLRRVRELHRMQRPLALELPSLQVPDGIVLRTFVPDVDDAAWVALNARAFADHPEQGRVSVEDLSQRRQQSWFDPAGFFVAERDGVMVGFHWTKVDGDSGEVYVLGVSPDAQGSGLGRVLTLRGLHHLRDAGLDAVHLYVEADNAAALAMYARLGFTTAVVDVLYRWG